MAQQQGQAPYPTTIQPPAHHHVHHPYPPQHHPHIPYIPPTQAHPPFQTTYPYAQQYHPHQYGSVPGPTMPPMAHHQYPPQIPPYYPGSGSSSSRTSSKRPREAPSVSDPELCPSTKRQAVGNDVLFRVLVPASQIGKVIGKGGHRVQKVRDDTKATVKIADPIARYEERVIIISSKANDGVVTDAEMALLQIASLILADDGTPAASQTLNLYAGAGAADAPANSVKLLIAGSQAGGLIGVSGQNIEKLRSSSGATITVLSPNQLPLCASAQESDRLVQISGEVSSVIKAVEEIGIELRTNPPSEVISISPTYNLSIARVAQSYMDPNAAEYVTLDMVISETMVGGLIGRSGSNIARIRNESGAMIKVIGGKGEQKHRQIQLIGTAQQVALAKQRVDEYIYSQLTQ